MPSTRIIWLDNLKAFLILMVVLGHTLLFTNNDGTGNVVYRIISSFWMPMFMFTSGFSSFKENVQWIMIKRRFFQLIIPFLAWSLILCVTNRDYHFEQSFIYPTKSMWFLFALFFIIAIHVVACKIAGLLKLPQELVVCMVAILLWGLQRLTRSTVFCTDLISYHFVFYSLGFYVRKYFDTFSMMRPFIFIILGISFFAMAFFRHDNYLQEFHIPHNMYIIYDFICALLSVGPFVYIFKTFYNKYFKISKIGSRTLGIYVIHITVFRLLRNYIPECINIEINNVLLYSCYVVLTWLIVFGFSYFFLNVLLRTKYLKIIFLGSK